MESTDSNTNVEEPHPHPPTGEEALVHVDATAAIAIANHNNNINNSNLNNNTASISTETNANGVVVVAENTDTLVPPPLPPASAAAHDSSESSWMENWGAMGGGIGEDNAFLVQHPSTTTPSHTMPLPNSEYASMASVFMEEQQQPTPGGSITRFASEAARAVGATNTSAAHSSNTPHGHDTMSSTTYVSPFAKPVPQPPMSFAERSQQAYIKSGSAYIPTTPTAATVAAATAAVATGPPPQVRMYGASSGATAPIPVGRPNMYTPQAAPAPVYNATPTAMPPSSSSFSSNQFHSNVSPQARLNQPQSQSQPYHPAPNTTTTSARAPVVVVPAAGSYAARSAAAVISAQPPTTMYGASTPTPQSSMPQQQQQQQPYGSVMSQPQRMGGASMMGNSLPAPAMHRTGIPVTGTTNTSTSSTSSLVLGTESTQFQQKILTDSIRKVQEHAYYMKQAMDQKNLAVTLDRAAHMVGELGGPPHGHPTTSANTSSSSHNQSHGSSSSGAPTNTGVSAKLTPKNYYDLYMRALEDMPLLEEYLHNLAMIHDVVLPNASPNHNPMSLPSPPHPPTGMIHIVADASQLTPPIATTGPKYTMKQLYDCVQYCPRVVSRLYLQIAAGSALIRSGECSAKYVMADLQDAVRCEQNPVRGLFLRYFLITALRDKLPDIPPPSTVSIAASTTNTNTESDEKVNDNNDAPSSDKEAKIDNNYMDESEADMKEEGTVKDSYEFILSNFMEMNKLWVRIQHLPGEGKDKEARKRRERERNDLRILVGTNLVRLSQLECVTSKIYGEDILPYILEHIVTTGDPLSQAYLMDCLVQVFPDEYHIETLPILLNVCPRLKDKVNIRTILQGLMDRLAKYLADEELLDESDTNQVKISLAKDSFGLFEECVQKVYNARGPKLTSKEVIRLQTALLQYSIKCFPGHVEQVGRCIDSCVTALQQANASYDTNPDSGTTTTGNSNTAIGAALLDDASVAELEKLLSIPLDSLALKVLEFDTYSQLISFLPWQNRREVAISMLKAVENSGSTPNHIKGIEQLFHVIEPLVRDEMYVNYPQMQQQHMTTGMMQQSATRIDPNRQAKVKEENCHVAKLLHTLHYSNVDDTYNMLLLAKQRLTHELSGPDRTVYTLSALVYATFRLASRVFSIERNPITPDTESQTKEKANVETIDPNKMSNGDAEVNQDEQNEATTIVAKPVSSRSIFVLIQETIELIAKNDPEKGLKLYAEASAFADRNVSTTVVDRADMEAISYELLRFALTLYEDRITEVKCQCRCITSLSGTILALRSVSKENYESLITRTAQFAAKIALKPEQCQLVALCAHLFYPADNGGQNKYSNPQRALECLQRSLKLADACTTANPACVTLFVDLLEHYLYFFEKKNPLITHAYITGLIALINEHLNSMNAIGNDKEAKAHFVEVIRYIKKKKTDSSDVSDIFSHIQI